VGRTRVRIRAKVRVKFRVRVRVRVRVGVRNRRTTVRLTDRPTVGQPKHWSPQRTTDRTTHQSPAAAQSVTCDSPKHPLRCLCKGRGVQTLQTVGHSTLVSGPSTADNPTKPIGPYSPHLHQSGSVPWPPCSFGSARGVRNPCPHPAWLPGPPCRSWGLWVMITQNLEKVN